MSVFKDKPTEEEAANAIPDVTKLPDTHHITHYGSEYNVPYWMLNYGTVAQAYNGTKDTFIGHRDNGKLLAHKLTENDFREIKGIDGTLKTLSKMKDMREKIEHISLDFTEEYKIILSKYVNSSGFDFNSYAEEAVYSYATAYQYEGFNPVETRANLNLKVGSDPVVMLHILTLYLFCGNNYPVRLQKVKNIEAGAKASKMLTQLGIKVRKSDGGKEVLTLSRIAQSYIGVLLWIRSTLIEMDLIPKPAFPCTTPTVLCDLALLGFVSIKINVVAATMQAALPEIAAALVAAQTPMLIKDGENDYFIEMNDILYSAYVNKMISSAKSKGTVPVIPSKKENADRLVMFNNLARNSLKDDVITGMFKKYENLKIDTIQSISIRDWMYFYGLGVTDNKSQLIEQIRMGFSGEEKQIFAKNANYLDLEVDKTEFSKSASTRFSSGGIQKHMKEKAGKFEEEAEERLNANFPEYSSILAPRFNVDFDNDGVDEEMKSKDVEDDKVAPIDDKKAPADDKTKDEKKTPSIPPAPTGIKSKKGHIMPANYIYNQEMTNAIKRIQNSKMEDIDPADIALVSTIKLGGKAHDVLSTAALATDILSDHGIANEDKQDFMVKIVERMKLGKGT